MEGLSTKNQLVSQGRLNCRPISFLKQKKPIHRMDRNKLEGYQPSLLIYHFST